MEAWHRSADSLSRSKIRCQQSTVDALVRSAKKWHQSTDRLHRISLACEKEWNGTGEREEASKPNESTPDTESLQASQTHRDTQSPPSSLDFYTSTAYALQSPKADDSAEEQIRDILNLTDQVMYQANHTKQLRTSKSDLLGEIELDWINSTIFEASSAARDLAKLVEPYRLDILKRKGKMRSAHRKSWTLVDYESACERFSGLKVHREKLEIVSRHLQGVSEVKQRSSHESSDEVVAKLPAETMEHCPSVVKVCSEPASTTPQSDTTLVELPGNSVISKSQSMPPIPKIIVTQAPDDPLPKDTEGFEAEIFMPETEDTSDAPYWEQTCDSIRLQQSESLSDIVAKMESTRSS